MSRHTFHNQATNTEIAVGWDPGLDTYFAVVVTNDYDNPILWIGTSPREIQDPQPVIKAITPYANSLDPQTLSRQLLQDRQDPFTHKATSEAAAPTPTLPSTETNKPSLKAIDDNIAFVHEELQAHSAKAKTAAVHPLFYPGHELLIECLQDAYDHPSYLFTLPSDERSRIETTLQDKQRIDAAALHLDQLFRDVAQSKQNYEQLYQKSTASERTVNETPGYSDWLENATSLSALAKDMLHDRTSYAPILDHIPRKWQELKDSIFWLDTAARQDTRYVQDQHLYLKPITTALPTTNESLQAERDYRLLRQDWHDHISHAHSTNRHPYDSWASEQLINRMTALETSPHLTSETRIALLEQIHTFRHDQKVQHTIDDYLNQSSNILRRHDQLHQITDRLQSTGLKMQDIGAYDELKGRTEHYADIGKHILQDDGGSYSNYLDRSPDIEQRIRNNIERLNVSIGREQTAVRPDLHYAMPEQQMHEPPSPSRGIKL